MKKILLLSFVIVCLVSCQRGPSFDFKLNLQPGHTYHYSFGYLITQHNGDKEIKSNMQMSFAVTPLQANDNTLLLQATYEHIRASMHADENNSYDLDSDTPNTDDETGLGMFNKMFSAMRGKSFVMEVQRDGEIKSVKGFETLARQVVDSLTTDATMREQLYQTVRQQFNDEAAKKMFEQALDIFPDKPARVGASWTKNLDLPNPTFGSVNTNTTYKLRGKDGNNVVLTSHADINSKSAEMFGSQTGDLTVDANTGMVSNATFTQNIRSHAGGKDVMMTSRGTISAKE